MSDQVATPALFGVFRPKLLLPPRIILTLDPQSLRNVILHELQHLKRHHLAMDWLLMAIRAMHWFNPAGWWAHRHIRAARELICDQAVIASLSDADASRYYGHTLLTIASGALRSNEPSLVAAFARDQKLLRERIETIARTGKVKNIAGLGMLLTLILGMTFLTRPGRAQQAPPASQPTTMPMMDAVKHPENWPDLQQMRQQTQDQAANEAVYAALDRKLPEVRLDNVAFVDAIEFLRDVSSVNISVNWQALERAGVDRKALVSARMKDAKFSKILDAILDDVGGGNVKVSYTVEQGMVTISTAKDLASNVSTRVYDIRDLLDAAKPSDAKQRQELTAQLIKVVEDTVAPDSWKDRGGSSGTIREINDQLVIVQTPENQRQVRQLLDQLREKRAMQISVETRILTGIDSDKMKWTQHGDAEVAQDFLDDFQVNLLLRAKQAGVDTTTLSAPRLTLFNRQTVTASVVADNTAYVADIKTKPDGTLEPVIAPAQSGVTLSCTAGVAPDGRSVSLRLNTKISKLLMIVGKPWPEPPATQQAVLQEATMSVAEFDQTLDIPSGQTAVIRVTPKVTPPRLTPEKPVLILVRPTIILQRSNEPGAVPLAPTLNHP